MYIYAIDPIDADQFVSIFSVFINCVDGDWVQLESEECHNHGE